MEQNNTQEITNLVQESNTEPTEPTGTVTWYIKSGSLKGTSQQTDSTVLGLALATWDLLQKEPWAVLGDFIYGSKQSFESENPYLVTIESFQDFLMAQYASQKPQLPVVEIGPIKKVAGIH